MSWRNFYMGLEKNELLTAEQAAKLLGVAFTRFQAFRMRVGIPSASYKRGKKNFYWKHELEEFMRDHDVHYAFSCVNYYYRYGMWKCDWRPPVVTHEYVDLQVPRKKVPYPDNMSSLFLRGKFDPEHRQALRRISIDNAKANPPPRKTVHLSQIYGID